MPVTSRIAAAAARGFGLFSAIAKVTDAYFKYVTLLLPGNGTNGAQNNTFLDSSSNAFTITRNGNTTQGNFSPFSQTGWGNYFDGSTAYETFANSSAFAFGTSAFTIEGWVNSNGLNDKFILSGRAAIGTMHITYGGFGGSTPGCLRYVGSSTITTGSALISNGVWNHFAVVRDASNNITLYVNGVASATGTDTTNYTATTGTWYINANDSGPTVGGAGYISNLRINKGTAVYTSNFTPSTTPLTAISGTSLLTCQANRFLDASSNAITITLVGTPSVQPFSPFNPTSAWSASSNGGSGYFDGSGDYLSVANNAAFNLGTNSFCIDGWFYPTTTNATQLVFNKWGTVSDTQSMFQIGRISSTFYAQLRATGGYVTLSTSTWIPNAWNHFAVVRSGSTISAYLNGARFGTDTSNPTLNSGTDTMTIGSKQAQDYFTGYITDCRIVNGSAIYDPTQTTITVPTAPTTAVTNTAFLSSNTNGGITDATAKNDLETVGNAQISTTQSKFGGSSMYFDGSGDDLKIITNPPLSFSGFAGDFTIEAWVYPTAVGQSNNSYLCSQINSGSYAPIVIVQSSGTYNFVIYASSTGSSWNLASAVSCGTANANAWNHVAVTRYGTNIYCFMNGVLQSTTAVSTTAFMTNSNNWHIGSADLVANSYLTGYVDDFRITKGIARYTSNFTPPTSAFLTL